MIKRNTASSVEIYTVMGLFNTGKNDKVDKVEKYEEHNDASPSKSHRRSSKHHSKKYGAIVRPMPQPPMMPPNGNYFTPNFGYFPQLKYGFPSNSPYDLSKYVPSSLPFNPFMGFQPPTNFAPIWSNGMSPFNDRSPFQQQQQQQQPFNMGWPCFPPSNNGYMPPPMNF